MAHLARTTFALAMLVGLTFFLVSLLIMRQPPYDSALFMIGVMTALVPEGLQITVSTALALAVLDMARRNVLVKRLSAVQALGSVTVIATDKTGTITKGEMTVSRLWVYDREYVVTDACCEPAGQPLTDPAAQGGQGPVGRCR